MAQATATAQASLYDSPAHWFDPAVLEIPTGFNLKAFQARIDKAVGKSLTGQPIIKLSWAPAVLRYEVPAIDEHKNLFDKQQGEWIPKYRCFQTELPGLGIIRLAPPRFVLEQRIEPAQYLPHWNANRFGDAPPDGLYEFLCYVADHGEDNACCIKARRLYRQGKLENPACYGLFRFPQQDTIALLQYAKQMIEANENHLNPHGALSEAALAEARAYGRQIEEQRATQRRMEAEEMAADFYAPILHRIGCDDPSVLAHGRYHDVTASYQKSKRREQAGILIPQDS